MIGIDFMLTGFMLTMMSLNVVIWIYDAIRGHRQRLAWIAEHKWRCEREVAIARLQSVGRQAPWDPSDRVAVAKG